MESIFLKLLPVIGAALLLGAHATTAPKVAEKPPEPVKQAVQVEPSLPSDKEVTQVFGVNKASYKRFGVEGHTGTDIGADCHDPVKSPVNGIVIDTGSDKDYGNFVWIEDYEGYRHLFGHYESVSAVKGKAVFKGEVTGATGKTGNSTGCHIHWGVVPPQKDSHNGFGGFVDPLKWVKEPAKCPKLYNVPLDLALPICNASAKYHADPVIVASIIFYENRSWPDLDKHVCSGVGACGIAQFMPKTFEAYGVDADGDGVASRDSGVDSIYSAANYIGRLGGDIEMVGIKYNCGPSCIGKPLPAETTDYLEGIKKAASEFSH